ncbi:MAG: PocR ligand-binding domain-containing protein, partial [Deltaproteobacteria bacterium]
MAHQHVMSSYMEHGYCFSWEPGLVWLHVASDIITGISYYAITLAMFYVAFKRRDLPILKILLLFGAFIIACGSTHFFAAYTVYVPAYWAEGAVKAFTAIISAISAIYVIPRLPEAITFPSLASSLDEIKKLNYELKAKNAELQMANHSIEKLIDPVFWISPNGRILKVNEAACKALGYSRDEMTLMSITDIDSNYTEESWPEQWENLKSETSVRFETQHRSKDGTLNEVEVVANYISFEDQEFNCATVRDITDRKQLERIQAHRIITLTSPEEELSDIHFTDLFDIEEIQAIQDAFASATGVASLITDINGNPITRPSNFCTLCMDIIRKTEKGLANCCRSDAALGRINPDGPMTQPCLSGGLWDGGTSICVGNRHVANWLIGQVLDEDADLDNMMSYARDIGADEDMYRLALKDVKRMSISQFREISNTLFLIARQLSRMAMQNIQQARHIAERKRNEKEREELIHKLEDKTTELERFIYTVSHDLKSPLITISGFLGFLREDFASQDKESFESTISRITGASEKMKQLLDELLELSRIGRKINSPQQVDVGALVKETIELVSGRIYA